MPSDKNNPRSLQIDAAVAEFLEAAERGTPLARDEFLAQHADIAVELREFLGDHSAVERDAPRGAAKVEVLPQPSQGIEATCPNGHRLRIAAKLAGRRVKCPKCQEAFVVREAPASAPAEAQSECSGEPLSRPVAVDETQNFKHFSLDDTSAVVDQRAQRESGAHREVGQRFGQFELVEVLGEGGFGAVYRARNSQLDRDVALKLPRPGALGDKDEVARFLREAQAAAQLHHPHIVPVYDAGRIEGTYYIASAYIAGKSLRQEIDAGKSEGDSSAAASTAAVSEQSARRRFTYRETAMLVSQLASALNYAHQKGIFHRDVKPANIMLDTQRQPHLMDFGLARRMEGDTLRTMEGIRMGTPAYMSPEQAKGDSHLADARSDLWSLGVILYELLTGRLPFVSQQVGSLLHEILENEPDAPRKIDSSIPKDLDTICLKCLSKEPVRRYPSCQHLADELERWLKGEPITARAIGWPERSWRWARRRPAVAALSGVLLAVLATVVVVAPIVAVQQALLRKESGRLLTQNEEALRKMAELLQQRDDAIKLQKEAMQLADDRNAKMLESLKERAAAIAQKEQSLKERDEAMAQLRPQLADHMFERAAVEYGAGRYSEALALLGAAYEATPSDHPLRASARRLFAGWAAQAGMALVHDDAVLAVAYSADGKMAITGSHDKTARLWDASSGIPLGEPLQHPFPVRAVAFSPDGKKVVTSCGSDNGLEGEVQLWDVETRKPIFKLSSADKHVVYALCFSPDGSTLLTAGNGGAVRLWNAYSGDPIGLPMPEEQPITSVAFSSYKRAFYTAGSGKTVHVWEAEHNKLLGDQFTHESTVTTVGCNADGRLLATGCTNGQVQIWEISTGKRKGDPLEHDSAVRCLAFGSDGGSLVVGYTDGTAQQWNIATGQPMGDPLRSGGTINSLALSHDGRFVLVGSTDRCARIWDTQPGNPTGEPMQHFTEIHDAAINPDGKTVATGCHDGTVQLWNKDTRQAIGEPMRHGDRVSQVSFSADGRLVLSVGAFQTVRWWNVETQAAIVASMRFDSKIYGAVICPDSQLVLTRSGDVAQFWNAENGQARGQPIKPGGTIFAAAFSRDGRLLATGGTDASGGQARLWNVQNGQSIGKLMQHKLAVEQVAFSPNGNVLLTGSSDQTARLWEAASGKPLGDPLEHNGRINSVAFSPDGHLALTASDDQTARFWDVTTCQPVGEPLRHDSPVSLATFSPDGQMVVTLAHDGTVRLWDTSTCKPIGRLLQRRGGIRTAAFSRDGALLLSVCEDNTARLWIVPQPLADNPEFIQAWVATHAAMTVNKQGAVDPISSSQWLEAQKKMEALKASNPP